jgi:putative membrane-bound dehydrogenase-like protein
MTAAGRNAQVHFCEHKRLNMAHRGNGIQALRVTAYGLVGLCLLAISACTPPNQSQDSVSEAYSRLTPEERRSPEWAVAGLDDADGLETTLFASEPMLVNPSNMDVDHRGRVWAIEVMNYRPERNPANPYREEGDRILILEDTDGDGEADEQTVFYQGTDISAALGIAVLGNRAIVSASPDILVLTDEDGDGMADSREVLFSGMGGEDHDHGTHAAVFGPDGKLYFNFGNSGRQIHDADGNPIVDAAGNPVQEGSTYREGMVFRSDIDGSNLEVLGHNFRNNYEVAVDAFGTLWQSDNDDDGNRSVRINYVMEYGNFGYVDEVTGAGWQATRTNMEEEIPRRHWHQNDPGVVPNVLITGAGSPTGILVYEGDLLPEVFRNQMIHADAGPNVIRAYPVEDDGAGYSADMVNVVEGTRDQRFRPSDLTAAPDGSLFIADWYDPMVGGHEMIDSVGRGRIFRVAPSGEPYDIPSIDLETAEGAADALTIPNQATQYLAWTALHEMQAEAEPALRSLWESSNPRHRARALWLLTKIEGRADTYIEEALSDPNEDIRITGIRAARQVEVDLISYLQQVADDPSPQVRREAAIALRDHEAPEAAAVWADLAAQHDGQDRWYLEALGIGAERQWDRYFEAWLDRSGDDWNTPAGRDIVWRSRSAAAMPLMAEIVANEETDGSQRLRYFRAFDFHEHPTKDDVLLSLLDEPHPDQTEIRALALTHVSDEEVISRPGVRDVLDETLASLRGTDMFVDLVVRYDLRDQNEGLMEIVLDDPQSPLALDGMRHLVESDGHALIERELEQGDAQRSAALVTAFGQIDETPVKDVLENIMFDETLDVSVRRAAVQGLGRGWGGERRLLAMAEEGRLPEELHAAAAGVLLQATRQTIREAAAPHLGMNLAEGSELPPMQELAARSGSPSEGRPVFDQLCQSCHLINGQGTSFGPDLSEIGDKLPKEALYLAVIDPSAGITHGYQGVEVQLNDGGQVVGYLVSETPDAVEIRIQGGTTRQLARDEIASTTEMETSLMTPGLYQLMTEQEFVDMVEYLSTLRHAEVAER